MMKSFIYIFLLLLPSFSDNLKELNSIRDEIIRHENISQEKSDLFVTVEYGKSRVSLSTNLDTIHSVDEAYSKSGDLVNISVGYYFNPNIYSTISYQSTGLDLLYLDNFYTSLNYQLSDTLLQPSFGFLFGVSSIKWDDTPVKNTISSNLKETKALFGCQSSLYSRLSSTNLLFFKYQYMYMNHNLSINNNSAYLRHKDENNLIIGVKHEFK